MDDHSTFPVDPTQPWGVHATEDDVHPMPCGCDEAVRVANEAAERAREAAQRDADHAQRMADARAESQRAADAAREASVAHEEAARAAEAARLALEACATQEQARLAHEAEQHAAWAARQSETAAQMAREAAERAAEFTSTRARPSRGGPRRGWLWSLLQMILGTSNEQAWQSREAPGARAGLTILPRLDNVCGRMHAAGFPIRIAQGLRTIDEQIQLYAKGRTLEALSDALQSAVGQGLVTQERATHWRNHYDPAQGGQPMPPGEPGPVTWTLNSRHLTGTAADIVHATLGWDAPSAFWDALRDAAEAEGLQIGPPASDRAHVQLP